MHDYQDPDKFYTTVRTTYRDVVARAHEDGTDLKNATDEVAEIVAPLIKQGDLTVPLDDLIRHAVNDVDRVDGRRADTALRAIANGEEALDLSGDPALDVVVKLGNGRRKSLRYITQADLMLMDELRYANMRNAQDSYDRWRRTYEPWFRVLNRHATVETAHASGDLPDLEDPSE